MTDFFPSFCEDQIVQQAVGQISRIARSSKRDACAFGGCSIPRNKEIMRVFRDLEIVEHLGSGVPRILKACDRDAFEIRDSYVRIIFRFEQVTEKASTEKRGEKRGEKEGEPLSKNRQKIVNAMRGDPFITHMRLIELVGIGQTNIEKNITYLKDMGWIRRVGPAKGGHWEVIDGENS